MRSINEPVSTQNSCDTLLRVYNIALAFVFNICPFPLTKTVIFGFQFRDIQRAPPIFRVSRLYNYRKAGAVEAGAEVFKGSGEVTTGGEISISSYGFLRTESVKFPSGVLSFNYYSLFFLEKYSKAELKTVTAA